MIERTIAASCSLRVMSRTNEPSILISETGICFKCASDE